MKIYLTFISYKICIHLSLTKLYNVLVGGNQSQLHHLLLVLPDYRGKKNICLQQTIRKGKKNNLLRAPNLFALGKLSKPLGDLLRNWICRQQGQFKKAPLTLNMHYIFPHSLSSHFLDPTKFSLSVSRCEFHFESERRQPERN